MIKLKSLFRRGQGPSGSKRSGGGGGGGAASSSSSLDQESVSSSVQTTSRKKQTNEFVDYAGKPDNAAYNYNFKDNQNNYRTNTNSGSSSGGRKKNNNNNAQVSNVMPPVVAAAAAATASHQPQAQSTSAANVTTATANNNLNNVDANEWNKDYKLNNYLAAENDHLEANMMQELQTQLERLGRENILLEAKISELMPYQSEVVKLRNELLRMQNLHEKSNMEIQKLKYENESLRNRLRDVVNSPLSDAEKHQIIQDSQRLHSSAPASIALPNANENDGTPCVTPDWDKNSSSSEISVACLQDKIIQMEETHYSTNEELQATIQELADLQAQLTELQSDNERLADEKDVLFKSLCRQTEKLKDSRTQITTLQELLLRESNQVEVGTSEREKKLLDLIKNSQEERETILLKQEEMNSELNELRQSVECASNDNSRFRERICLLDSTVDAANAERKQTESELQQAKEESSQKSIEISRLTTLLENARAKIEELEQDLARGEKTDLTDLLDAARKEKDQLEVKVASLQEQLSRSQNEIRKLKDQLLGLTEECKVAKNNAKCALSHLEYRYDTLQQEKDKLHSEYQQLQDNTAELQVQCKCHLEDKAQLQNLLGETQKHLEDAERKLGEKDEQLQKETKLRKQEAEEWQQFQSDLLMTVRVANDFKTEALCAREQLVLDNKTQREKIRMLEQQVEKLNKQISSADTTQQSLLTTVQQEMASRRSKISLSKQDSRLSVKTLIETIENNKQTKSEESESRYSSTSSLNSGTSELTHGTNTNIPSDWSDNVRIQTTTGLSGTTTNSTTPPTSTNTTTTSSAKGPLREQQQPTIVPSSMHFHSINNVSKSSLQSGVGGGGGNVGGVGNGSASIEKKDQFIISRTESSSRFLTAGERKDPLNMLVKNGGSKRNALLKWCQNKTVGYRNIDITNFSSSWNDGLAFCAILHSYLPDKIPYDTLSQANKRRNFSLAFGAAESVGIPTTLNINDMCQIERPDWTQVMSYVTAIYKHFET
ncbi:cytospin-A [Eupeodes corollae]|uniref:cytospin-A n=1 Tax=Eupeodes corollae TaxID=290404 RepID=UPI00249359F1|nr:cytospin-A [Eupeodes corollae]